MGSLGEGILTGPRLQGQDQDQGADHQVQAVEGPLPVAIVLVGVHDGDGEEEQELHGQLSGARRQDVAGGLCWLAAPRAQPLTTRLLVLEHRPCAGPEAPGSVS